tara:strand:- start:1398 stop:2603 length:1206 start_codon:yes stop_codon:yes gene_type:complete
MGKTSYRDRHGTVRAKPGRHSGKDPQVLSSVVEPVPDLRKLKKEADEIKDELVENGKMTVVPDNNVYAKLMSDDSFIFRLYPTHHVYDVGFDIHATWTEIAPEIEAYGYNPIDITDVIAGLSHPVHVSTKLAQICHQAKNSKDFIFIRRTPENSAFVLTLQRVEHSRGQVNEKTPLAYVAFVRDDQLLVTRSQTKDADHTKRLLKSMASNDESCPICELPLRIAPTTVLSCGHGCHSTCFNQLIESARQQHNPSANKTNSTITCPLCTVEANGAEVSVTAPTDVPGTQVLPLMQVMEDHKLTRTALQDEQRDLRDQEIERAEDALLQKMAGLAALADLEKETRPAGMSDEMLAELIKEADAMMKGLGLPSVSDMTHKAKALADMDEAQALRVLKSGDIDSL